MHPPHQHHNNNIAEDDEKASSTSTKSAPSRHSEDINMNTISSPSTPVSPSNTTTLNNTTNPPPPPSSSSTPTSPPFSNVPLTPDPDAQLAANRHSAILSTLEAHEKIKEEDHARKSSVIRPPLPPLPFHLREHRGAVAIISMIMIIDHGLLPPVVYFAMRYGTNVRPTVIFGIITAVFGIVLGIESLVRAIKLVLKNPKYRPLGQTFRFGMDFWQYTFTLCLIINVAMVSTGTALETPFINLLAMPMPTVIFNLSWQLLLSDFLHENKVKTPFRISSYPKGSVWPRFIFTIIEDVVAVDCNGKREWRQAWQDRVEASKPMRNTLKRLSTFWGVGGLCMSAISWGLLWGFDSVSGKEAGYALGWLLPWAWIIPSTVATTFYVKHRLKDERHFCQRYRGSIA